MLRKIFIDNKFCFFIIGLFLILTLPNLYYPGLNMDEANDGIVSSYIFKDVSNNHKPKLMVTSYCILLFNRIFPIMSFSYLGSVLAYLIFPFSHIFGVNVFSLRITPIFFSSLSLLFIYLTCKIWFGKRVAFLASLLTATNLLFVQYSRVGLHREEIFMIFFFWAGLLFLAKYSENQRNIFLYLSLYFWGLGLSAKITFLWYALGIIVACAILRKKCLLVSLNIRQSIIAIASFCSGAIFIILYNIRDPWITPRLLLECLLSPSFRILKEGNDNLAYLANLKIRMAHLIMILKGYIAESPQWGVRGVCLIEPIWPFIVSLILISLVLVLMLALLPSHTQQAKKYRILFFYIIFVTVFLLSPFTVSVFSPGHLTVLLPFPQIVIALFLDYIWQWARHRKIILITAFSIFLIPVLLFNIWIHIYFNIEMNKNGGYYDWSTAIYELKDYLQERKILSPLIIGGGIEENLIFITEEKVMPFAYDPHDPLAYDFKNLTKNYKYLSTRKESIFYLVTNETERSSYLLNSFMKLVQDDGKKCIEEKVFFNRAGDPIYWLYKIC
jgi:hypothetical protein